MEPKRTVIEKIRRGIQTAESAADALDCAVRALHAGRDYSRVGVYAGTDRTTPRAWAPDSAQRAAQESAADDRSEYVVPICSGGLVIGVLDAESGGEALGEEDRELLREAAALLAGTLAGTSRDAEFAREGWEEDEEGGDPDVDDDDE